jgi:hypothetical protein
MTLRLLEKPEIEQFRNFLRSPYHNSNPKLIPIFDCLLPYLDKKNKIELPKEALFKQLYPGENFNEPRIRNLFSLLTKQVQAFLVQQNLKEQMMLKERLLADELIQREGLFMLSKPITQLQTLLEQQIWPGQQFFMAEYELQHFQDLHLVREDKRAYSPHLQSQSQALDLFYLLEKLRIACDMQSRNFVVNANYTCAFVDEHILQYEKDEVEVPFKFCLDIYITAYNMFTQNPKRHYFDQLNALLSQYGSLIPVEELKTLYTYMLNIGVREVNLGNSDFYAEVHQLYKTLIDKDILLREGSLTQWAFTNIALTGIRLRDYDWTESFILQYAQYLPEEVRENALAFNRANLAFEKKEYGTAQKLLLNLEFQDAYYAVAAKILLLKIYFLKEETDPLLSLVETTCRMIERNRQLSDYQKKSNLNFFRFALKIHTQKNAINPSFTKMRRLSEQVEASKSLANKQWLLDQLPSLPKV